MDLLKYQQLATRTFLSKGIDLDRLHCVIGVISEIAELQYSRDDKNFTEEVGDILWYLSNYYTIESRDLVETISKSYQNTPIIEDLYYLSSIWADDVKKQVYYKSNFDFIKAEKVLSYLAYITKHKGFSIEYCAERNIEKLKVRYPKKFTEENAKNRDLEKEREVL